MSKQQIYLIYINKVFRDKLLQTKLNKTIKLNADPKQFLFFKQGKGIKTFEIQLNNDHFNQEMINILTQYIKSSLKEITSISQEPISYLQENLDIIRSAISSLVNKYHYFDFKMVDIFDFITDLFIRFLTGHYLQNGNKRFALVFVIQILFTFGYYFKYSKGSKRDYARYSQKITSFTTKLENKSSAVCYLTNPLRLEIKDWILAQIIIVIPWYNREDKELLKSKLKQWTKKPN